MAVQDEKPGLSVKNYTLKGFPVPAMVHAGIAKLSLGGIAGGERTVDRVTPVEQRRRKDGSPK